MARVPVQTDEEEVIASEPSEVQENSNETELDAVKPSLMSHLTSKWPPKVSIQQIATAIILIAILAALITLIADRNRLNEELERERAAGSAQADNQAEAEELKAKVSGFIELPVDELPTVATVVDASKVSDQPFFVRAQNGDKVLIFARSGKAILYRPSTNKIIEVSPINLGNSQAKDNQNSTQ